MHLYAQLKLCCEQLSCFFEVLLFELKHVLCWAIHNKCSLYNLGVPLVASDFIRLTTCLLTAYIFRGSQLIISAIIRLCLACSFDTTGRCGLSAFQPSEDENSCSILLATLTLLYVPEELQTSEYNIFMDVMAILWFCKRAFIRMPACIVLNWHFFGPENVTSDGLKK